MNRMIVFIAGADFSGTTMLDLILGSSTGCRSLGEVHSFFRPTVAKQQHVICSCGQLCDFWLKRADHDPGEFYKSIFKQYPYTRILIDSSKSVLWINELSARLSNMGYIVKHILIWKDLTEFRKSREKRGRIKGWASSWIRYHRAYLCKSREFFSINLNQLLNDFEVLARDICAYLGIQFEPNIKKYWRNDHHIVFGSATARLKLHAKGSPEYEQILQSSNRYDLNRNLDQNKLRGYGRNEPTERQKNEMENILNMLNGNSVKVLAIKTFSAQKDLFLYKIKTLVERSVFRIRFGKRSQLVKDDK